VFVKINITVMANNTQTGKYGEKLTAYILRLWDFEILALNWRFSKYEIDIIAAKDNILHFVEVKLRSDTTFGFPEESVNDKKIDYMNIAAEAYLSAYPFWKRVSFDIMAILLKPNGYEYRFFEDIN